MEDWKEYYEEAVSYHKTAAGARKKQRPFGNQVYYNLVGLSLEGYLTALITKNDTLPEHSSISSMLRMLKAYYEVPESFREESRFFNKFMNYCSLEVQEQKDPTDEEIDRMIKFVDDIKLWVDKHLGLTVETI